MKLTVLISVLCLACYQCGVRAQSPDVQEVEDNEAVDVATQVLQDSQTDPLQLQNVADETTTLVQDAIDALARGELVPPPIPLPGKPGLLPATPFEDAINAGKGLATAGGKLAQGALNLKAKLGVAITKPIAKGAVKLGAPVIKVKKLAGQNIASFTEPFVEGITDALNPIREATFPLEKAVAPIGLAVGLGLGDFDVDNEIADVSIEEDLERLANDAGALAEEAISFTAAGARAAGQAVQDAVQGVQAVFQGVGQGGLKKGRKRRSSNEGDIEYHNSEQTQEIESTSTLHFSNEDERPLPEGNDDILNLFVSPTRPNTGTCEAYRSRLVTSQCHRMEEYRTKTCRNLNCRPLNIEAIHRRCQVSAPGVHCEQNCYNFQDQNGDACFNCWFRFTRAISTTGKCQQLNECLFGSKICPLNNRGQNSEDDVKLQFVVNQNQQQQQQD